MTTAQDEIENSPDYRIRRAVNTVAVLAEAARRLSYGQDDVVRALFGMILDAIEEDGGVDRDEERSEMVREIAEMVTASMSDGYEAEIETKANP